LVPGSLDIKKEVRKNGLVEAKEGSRLARVLSVRKNLPAASRLMPFPLSLGRDLEFSNAYGRMCQS
jgi:hypothetical protein